MEDKDVRQERAWKSESTIMSHIARGPDGCTGYERMTGNTPDISEMFDFDI